MSRNRQYTRHKVTSGASNPDGRAWITNFSWFVRRKRKQLRRAWVYRYRKASLAERKFLMRFEGLPNILMFRVEEPIAVGDLVLVKARVHSRQSITAEEITRLKDGKVPPETTSSEGIITTTGRVKSISETTCILKREQGELAISIAPTSKVGSVWSNAAIDTERGEIPFVLFDPDRLPWDFSDQSRNEDLVGDLLHGPALKLVQIFYRPEVAEMDELDAYITEAVAEAQANRMYTEHMVGDLTAAKEYLAKERIRTVSFALYPPEFLREQDRKAVLDRLAFAAPTMRSIASGLMHGVWNRGKWDRLEKDWVEKRAHGEVDNKVMERLTPRRILWSPEEVVIEGIGGELHYSSLRTRGLGVRYLKEDDPQSEQILNTQGWLSSFLPFALEAKNEMIVVVTTYYIPDEPDETPGTRFKLGNNLSRREERDTVEDLEDLAKKKRKMTDAQRRTLQGFNMAMDLIERWNDARVRVSYKIGLAAATPTQLVKLRGRVQRRLEARKIATAQVKGRIEQLEDFRSLALPIIPEQDALVNTLPLPLSLVARDLKPAEEFPLPEGQVAAFVGLDQSKDRQGKPKFWPFGRSFICLGGQASGKTALGKLLLFRFHYLLSWDSMFWVYDGTNTVKPKGPQDFGWPFNSRVMNAGRLDNTDEAILYAEDYKSADQLYQALTRLRQQGTRLVVFSALDSWEQQYRIGAGFIRAYQEYMETAIPGMLMVDEISPIAKSYLAEEFFEHVLPDASKKNQTQFVLGHTKLGLSLDIRKTAEANVDRVLFGPTSLVADVPEEANILVQVFPEVAREVSDIVTELKVRGVPGVFVETGAGGKIHEVFQALMVYDPLRNLIERKPEEVRRKYGR